MRYEGLVWRYVPAGADPFHAHYMLHAGGRWNRKLEYGCFYSTPSREAAVAEYRKLLVRRGFDTPCDLVSFSIRVERVFDLAEAVGFPHSVHSKPLSPRGAGVRWADPGVASRVVDLGGGVGSVRLSVLVGNEDADYEACRDLADRIRGAGYLAIRAPSAARADEVTLPIYPENRPEDLEYGPAITERYPLNYGPNPMVRL